GGPGPQAGTGRAPIGPSPCRSGTSTRGGTPMCPACRGRARPSRSRSTNCAMRVRAFAKINLDLRVLGVRPDGYHELRTTFQSIALTDTLTFLRTGGPLRIECDDPAVPTGRTNLICKAPHLVHNLPRRRGAPQRLTV